MIIPEVIRAFISIELPEECKTQIRDFQLKLKSPEHPGIKWVAPDSMHITLKFLGNIRIKDIPGINSSIKDSVILDNPFTLKLVGTGFFPGGRKVRVFWLGLDGDVDKLAALQNRLEDSLMKLGFQREIRPFSAHLTLARFTDAFNIMDGDDFKSRVEKNGFKSDTSILVKSVHLMRSQLTPRGAIYTSLFEHNPNTASSG